MTTVVAPMGYGKTTAVEWYLAERAGAEAPYIVRISVYSSNLAIFWKSVQDAFARAGFAFLREYDCPTDGASGGLLIDDLCHALTGEKSCYIFIDRQLGMVKPKLRRTDLVHLSAQPDKLCRRQKQVTAG